MWPAILWISLWISSSCSSALYAFQLSSRRISRQQQSLSLLSISRKRTILLQELNNNENNDNKNISSKTTTTTTMKNNNMRQTLLFREAKTGVPVHIIGTMHYNPYSISKTESIIRYYGERNQLGSVVIESCPLRWQLLQQKQPPESLLRSLLDNEFQAAAEVGKYFCNDRDENEVGVVLADEDIEQNDKRINEVFVSSVKDFLNPMGGGWTSISDDIIKGYSESFDPSSKAISRTKKEDDDDNNYLTASDVVFDLNMLLGAPISITRYAFAILLRKPIKGILLFGWINILLTLIITRVGFNDYTLILASLGGFILSLLIGIPLMGRVYLFALLGERNTIIAQNIRKECMQIVDNHHNSSTTNSTSINKRAKHNENNNKVCVAVLGLAHCNGVKHVLCDDDR